MDSIFLALTLIANPVIGVTAPNCPQPDVPASVTQLLYSPVPSIAGDLNEHGTAEVIVRLRPAEGRPVRVTLASSTGYPAADRLAITLVQHTTFKPELQSCSAVGGDYFYKIEV